MNPEDRSAQGILDGLAVPDIITEVLALVAHFVVVGTSHHALVCLARCLVGQYTEFHSLRSLAFTLR